MCSAHARLLIAHDRFIIIRRDRRMCVSACVFFTIVDMQHSPHQQQQPAASARVDSSILRDSYILRASSVLKKKLPTPRETTVHLFVIQ